jgi:membrane protease YdiL (CAAX protease family)
MEHRSPTTEPGYPSRRSQLYEVSVFIFLIAPSMVLSYFAVKQQSPGFVLTALGTIFHNLAFLSLIVFFAWKNGEPMDRFGWVKKDLSREVTAGLWLFLLMVLMTSLISQILSGAGVSLPSKPLPSFLTARSPAGYALAAVLVVVVAISEETMFRGYLIVRLNAVTHRRLLAVLLSTSIFALGHGYEGKAGVVAVFFIGLFLAVVYLWRKSLVAPMVIHFLQDLMGLFVIPLLKQSQ